MNQAVLKTLDSIRFPINGVASEFPHHLLYTKHQLTLLLWQCCMLCPIWYHGDLTGKGYNSGAPVVIFRFIRWQISQVAIYILKIIIMIIE